MKIAPARIAAFDVLMRVETERAFTSVLLPQYEANLSERDRALCHELVLGTLRRQLFLDRLIQDLASAKTLDPAVRVALRLGLYQLCFLDRVPVHAAVGESVELVRRARKTSAKAFVNAVLRRAASERREPSFTGEIDRLSVETSHPAWLLERWTRQFGSEAAAAIASANNVPGRHAFRIIGGTDDLPAKSERSQFVDGCFLTDRIDRQLAKCADRGDIYFQDEASQLVATMVRISRAGRFLDVCAAPGGKTGLVARRHSGITRLVVAGDLYWPRVVFLRENCERQNAGPVAVVQYDAEVPLPFADESFDTVLVDAPCSGTGTIRHNPEIRHSLAPEDFADLADKQRNILRNASKLVKRGGSLVYSTCSLETDENEDVVRQFLSSNREFTSIVPNVPERFITSDGFARTWPHRDEMDGFFIASLHRE